MKLNAHFEAFHSQVSLDQTRVDRIRAAHSSLREILEQDENIKDIFINSFLQGSYAIGTALRPKEDEEFDVDVVLTLDLVKKFGYLPSSSFVIAWLFDCVNSYEKYKGKARVKRKCVRIDYADGFHIDLLPANEPRGSLTGIQVPPHWLVSNPVGYKEWCEMRNMASGGRFTRIGKYLKRWRNQKLGQDSSLKSIVLTTLVGKHLTHAYGSDAEALVSCIESLDSWTQEHDLVPTIWNPSLSEGVENLARDWRQSDFADFRKRLNADSNTARAALDEEDRDKAIELWEVVLGEDFSGSVGVRAAAMSSAIREGTAVIALGTLTENPIGKSRPIRVIPVRQYGK